MSLLQRVLRRATAAVAVRRVSRSLAVRAGAVASAAAAACAFGTRAPALAAARSVNPPPPHDPAGPVGWRAKSAPSVVTNPELYPYSLRIGVRHTAEQQALWAEIGAHERGVMASTPDSSAFIAWLAGTLGAKRCIEVGVFAGSTTLAVALALPRDGRIVALDVSEDYTAIGRRYWRAAGVESRVDLRIGDAQKELQRMARPKADGGAGEAGTYDLAFIDADKPSYDAYYEQCLALLRPGGVVVVDNVYFHARVLDPKETSAGPTAIRALNAKIHADPRVAIATLPLADGVTVARKL